MVDFQTQIVPQLKDHHHGGLCSTTAISENDCGSITKCFVEANHDLCDRRQLPLVLRKIPLKNMFISYYMLEKKIG